MVVENNMLMALNWDPNKYRDFNNHGELFPEIDMEAVEELWKAKDLAEQMSEYDEEEENIPKANNSSQQTQKQANPQPQQTVQEPRHQQTVQNQQKPVQNGPIILESQTAPKRSDFKPTMPKVDSEPSPVNIKLDDAPKPISKPKTAGAPIEDIDDDDII